MTHLAPLFNRERGVALVLVSHDISVVAREVTKLACLNRRLVFHGAPRTFSTTRH